MSKKILGREYEKARLASLLKSDKSEFVAIFGRRRVGKTFLIRQFYKNEIVFDLSGEKDGTLAVQMENFFEEYARRTKGKQESAKPQNWKQAFTYLYNYLLAQSNKEKKMVVFLDEMPWMDTARSQFVSSLEHSWNQQLSKIDGLILVACGSASSWIQKFLLQARGGLHNRITQRIKLEPFTLAETANFFKAKKINLTQQTVAELYMVMGGVPHYLEEVKENKSTAILIDKLCFKKNSLLNTEYNYLYQSLFNNAATHIAIVETLALKPYGMTQTSVVKATKLPQGSVSKALKDLEESSFVNASVPYGKKKKDTLYRLIDNYSLFYNRFIKYASAKTNWKSYLTSHSYQAWCGYAYENICLTHAKAILQKLHIAGIDCNINSWQQAGSKQKPGAQIDLLIDRADKWITMCEIKYTIGNYTIGKKEALTLQQKRQVFTNSTGTKKQISTCLITLNAATKNDYYHQEIETNITLKDFFEERILE